MLDHSITIFKLIRLIQKKFQLLVYQPNDRVSDSPEVDSEALEADREVSEAQEGLCR